MKVLRKLPFLRSLVLLLGITPSIALGGSGDALTLEQLMALVRIPAPDSAIAKEIDRRGVDFGVTRELIGQMENLGAGRRTLERLESVLEYSVRERIVVLFRLVSIKKDRELAGVKLKVVGSDTISEESDSDGNCRMEIRGKDLVGTTLRIIVVPKTSQSALRIFIPRTGRIENVFAVENKIVLMDLDEKMFFEDSVVTDEFRRRIMESQPLPYAKSLANTPFASILEDSENALVRSVASRFGLSISDITNILTNSNPKSSKPYEVALYGFVSRDAKLAEARLKELVEPFEQTSLERFYQVHFALGHIQFYQAKFEKAAEQFSLISEYYPSDISVLNSLAHANLSSLKKSRALEAVQLAIKLGEGNAVKGIALAESYNILGGIHFENGNFDEAEKSFLHAISLAEKIELPEEQPLKLLAISNFKVNLGALSFVRGNAQDAVAKLSRVLADLETEFGTSSSSLVNVLHNLGVIYTKSGDFAKASNLLERVLTISSKYLPKYHPFIGIVRNDLGGLYMETGRFVEAEISFNVSIELLTEALGEKNSEVANVKYNLGSLYRRIGRFDESLTLLKEAEATFKGLNELDTLRMAETLTEIGGIYYLKGEYRKTLPLWTEALKKKRAIFPGGSQSLVSSINNIAQVLKRMRMYQEAEVHFLEALKMLDRIGDISAVGLRVNLNFAEMLKERGRNEEAARYENRANSIRLELEKKAF